MSKQEQIPGQWFIEPATEGRDVVEWNVTRFNPVADPSGRYEFESMTDSRGHLAKFNSPAEARAAIAAA